MAAAHEIGDEYLDDGDWVITEPDGEHHYPCKPDIFEATYEEVEDKPIPPQLNRGTWWG